MRHASPSELCASEKAEPGDRQLVNASNIPPSVNTPPDHPNPTDRDSARMSRRRFLGAAVAGGMVVASVPPSAAIAARSKEYAAPAPPQPRHVPGDRKLAPVAAQKLGVATLAAYQRAVDLWALTDGKVLNATIEPTWLDGEGRFWYVATRKGGIKEYIIVDSRAGTQAPIFDRQKLSNAIAALRLPRPNPDQLQLEIISVSNDQLKFNYQGHGFDCHLPSFMLKKRSKPWPAFKAADPFPDVNADRWAAANPVSPDGRWMVFIRDFNVVLQARKSKRETILTSYGVQDDYFESVVYRSPGF